MEKLNDFELMSLNQALYYIRFKCQDSEAVNIKCSRFLMDTHLKILENLKLFYKKENLIINHTGFIEDQPEGYLFSIISTIRSIENWRDLTDEIKISQIEVLVSPYKIMEETQRFLLSLK